MTYVQRQAISTLDTKSISPRLLWDPRHLLAFGFGSGLSPWAPGTVGTITAIPLYWVLSQMPLSWYILVLIVGFLLGIYLCGFSSRALGIHDHAGIVWDEFIGFWMTMLAAPVLSWEWTLIGFALFRFFDIVKPWPIKLVDARITGGFGIMIDDVLAAVYAMIGLQGVQWLMVQV